ncbi:hypothetical protein [Enterobacter asburiae]|uniref:hypothetical protein n=1 Tax=Enterobacter asburiae TaxID=61645 RepID=UPI003BD7D7AF
MHKIGHLARPVDVVGVGHCQPLAVSLLERGTGVSPGVIFPAGARDSNRGCLSRVCDKWQCMKSPD